MEYFHEGSTTSVIDEARASELLDGMLEQMGDLERVLLLPPDVTRYHSWSGELCILLYEKLKDRAEVALLPAIGTHYPMKPKELDAMFPGIPHDCFRNHDWRGGITELGEVPSDFVKKVSEGKLDYSVTCEVDRILVEERWDRIISIGQLVPHEVIGIANHNKNVFVGCGGPDTINKTHFLGAVYGMERVMGRESSPVRDVLDYMSENFTQNMPLSYLLTVRGKDAQGKLVTRGLFAGDDKSCYLRGADLCQQTNLDLLDAPLNKVVVFLDPQEFKSTWLGNKAIYRTRMAMADEGELIVIGPGVEEFGEDKRIDELIRKYGYRGTPYILQMVDENEDLRQNLSAAAHLIHGSSEGRFRITYAPGHLSREEVESAGFEYADINEMLKRYDPEKLNDGPNVLEDGEEIFFVSNPALGLWGLKSQFE